MMAASQRVLLKALTWLIWFILKRCWLIMLGLSAILLLRPADLIQAQRLVAPPVDALVLVEAASIEAMDEAAAFIEAGGGQVFVTFAPHALLVKLPPDDGETWVGRAGIQMIITGPADTAQIKRIYGNQAGLAARTWNDWRFAATLAEVELAPGADLVNDALSAPDQSGELEAQAPPLAEATSEFLYGRVQVDVFLVESNGAVDPETETWTTGQRDSVVSEVTAGVTWWAATATQGDRPPANLSFNLTFHTPFDEPAVVGTDYEPIMRSSFAEDLWIGQIMSNLGYNGHYRTAVRQYVHQRRLDTNRDWAFTIFVVNSEADNDGQFSNGRFAYAYLQGPFMVMTYDNNGWGISRMGMVTAHEMGHIFGALDEHITSACTDTETGGYLDVANSNCENGDPPTEDSIMRGGSNLQLSYFNNLASTPVRGQVGWCDSDSDGLYDVVDTDVTLSATFVSGGPAGQPFRYNGVAADIPYDSPTRPDASINTIASVEYRLDESEWLPAEAGDGSFDEYTEDYSLTLPTLTAGMHTIQIRARNSVSNYSPLFNDTIIGLATPTGVLASDGIYTDRIRLTWDAVVEASSYEIWRSTTNASDSASLIATINGSPYEDTAVIPEQIYYYWVKAKRSTVASDFSLADAGWRELAVPTNAIASDGAYVDRVRITWSPIPGATNYTLYRAASLSGHKLLIGSVNDGSYYDDFSAEAHMTYYYFVTASNSYGSSDYSTADTGYVMPLYWIYLPMVME
jgi:hypothetical protein